MLGAFGAGNKKFKQIVRKSGAVRRMAAALGTAPVAARFDVLSALSSVMLEDKKNRGIVFRAGGLRRPAEWFVASPDHNVKKLTCRYLTALCDEFPKAQNMARDETQLLIKTIDVFTNTRPPLEPKYTSQLLLALIKGNGRSIKTASEFNSLHMQIMRLLGSEYLPAGIAPAALPPPSALPNPARSTTKFNIIIPDRLGAPAPLPTPQGSFRPAAVDYRPPEPAPAAGPVPVNSTTIYTCLLIAWELMKNSHNQQDLFQKLGMKDLAQSYITHKHTIIKDSAKRVLDIWNTEKVLATALILY